MKILDMVIQYQYNEYMEYHSLNVLVLCVFQLHISVLILKFYSFSSSVFILKGMSWNMITCFLKSVLTFEDAVEMLQEKCSECMV